VKTILVFLLSLTLAIVLPNPVWTHGGGAGGSGGGSHGGGGAGSSSASTEVPAAPAARATAVPAAAAQVTAAVLTPAGAARGDKWDTAPKEGKWGPAAPRV